MGACESKPRVVPRAEDTAKTIKLLDHAGETLAEYVKRIRNYITLHTQLPSPLASCVAEYFSPSLKAGTSVRCRSTDGDMINVIILEDGETFVGLQDKGMCPVYRRLSFCVTHVQDCLVSTEMGTWMIRDNWMIKTTQDIPITDSRRAHARLVELRDQTYVFFQDERNKAYECVIVSGNVIRMTCGSNHIFLLTGDGRVYHGSHGRIKCLDHVRDVVDIVFGSMDGENAHLFVLHTDLSLSCYFIPIS